MNNLTKTLLGSAALCALGTVPALATHVPKFHVLALLDGRVVNKTKLHNPGGEHITYTLGISTSVSASDLHKTVPLAKTFYKWSSYTDNCNNPRQKIKAQKKTAYAKISAATETYTVGDCTTVFYGDTYKLKDKSGFGQTDSFVSTLYGWFKGSSGAQYKGTLKLDVSVAIGADQPAENTN